MYWTEAPAEQVAPIRAKIQDVLEMLDMVSRADMRRVRDMLLGAFHLLTPGAQYQQVSMAAMELQDVTDMLKFRHAPLVAGCIDSAACAAKSLLFNMDECLEA
jgi:hypothetical protein